MSDVIVYILGVIVSVALSLASNIHFGEKERGWCVSDVSTVRVHALVFSNFRVNGWLNPEIFSLKPSVPQGESSLKISAHQFQPFQRS